MKFQRRSRNGPRIDIVPLIDVIFFVLLLFILYSRFDSENRHLPGFRLQMVHKAVGNCDTRQNCKYILVTVGLEK